MFGFVVANPEKLTEEQRKHYRAVYCGLCRALGKEHGFIDRHGGTLRNTDGALPRPSDKAAV